MFSKKNPVATLKASGAEVAIFRETGNFPFAVYERLNGSRKWDRINAYCESADALRFAGERFAMQAKDSVTFS